jgi:hypothetical protein
MTLPSGTISFNDLRNEYGIGGAISLAQLYGQPGIQTGGAISMYDFWGKSSVVFSPAGSSATSYIIKRPPAGENALVLAANANGVWTYNAPAGVTASLNNGDVASSASFTITGFSTYDFQETCSVGGVSHLWNCHIATENQNNG